MSNIPYNKYCGQQQVGILEEIKQRKPFSSLEEELGVSLALTAELVNRAVESLLKRHNLTPTQYNVLRILRGAGMEGLTCGEISVRMIRRDSDITRLLDRMERRGHVARKRGSSDRRVVRTVITEEGMEAVGGLDEPIEALFQRTMSGLARQEMEKLAELLGKVREGTR
jgi:DNA-binding MarR family transcriptional regulator